MDAMDDMECRISIEQLDNGWEVTVPDYEAMKKKMADAKKSKDSMGGTPYMGDCCKKFAATSTKEVLALVKNALGEAPESEYDAAFESAAEDMKE